MDYLTETGQTTEDQNLDRQKKSVMKNLFNFLAILKYIKENIKDNDYLNILCIVPKFYVRDSEKNLINQDFAAMRKVVSAR